MLTGVLIYLECEDRITPPGRNTAKVRIMVRKQILYIPQLYDSKSKLNATTSMAFQSPAK